jgi:hypothetical protein
MVKRFRWRLLCLVALVALAWRVWQTRPPQVTRDVGSYERVLREWAGSGLVGEFPPSVPAGPTRVRFSAYPGSRRGGSANC